MNNKIIIAILAIIGILITTGTLLFFGGIGAVLTFLKWIAIIIFAIVLIGITVWAFYYFFIKKHKFDATAVNKKKLVIAGKMQCPEGIKGRYLRLSGDERHSTHIFGKIAGYLQIQLTTRHMVFNSEGEQQYLEVDGKDIPKYTAKIQTQDVFIIERGGRIANFFNDPYVVRVDPKDHDELIGDVTLFGINLVPISEYWMLSHDHMNIAKIDQNILQEAERSIMFELMRDWKSSIDQAIDLDAKHRKNQEDRSLFEIPQMQKLQGEK